MAKKHKTGTGPNKVARPPKGRGRIAAKEPLTVEERSEFEKHEGVLRTFAGMFRPAGEALKKIREKKLYREVCRTWAEYCDSRFGMGKSQANRLIACAEMTEKLTRIGVKTLPESTSQMEALLRLKEPEIVKQVWVDQLAEHGESGITAAKIKAAVDARLQGAAAAEADSAAEDKANAASGDTEPGAGPDVEPGAEVDAEVDADAGAEPGADTVPNTGSLEADDGTTGGDTENEAAPDLHAGESFALADGTEKVIQGWIEGAIDRRRYEKGLRELAKKHQPGDAAIQQSLFLEFVASANRATQGLSKDKARCCAIGAGRMIWEVAS